MLGHFQHSSRDGLGAAVWSAAPLQPVAFPACGTLRRHVASGTPARKRRVPVPPPWAWDGVERGPDAGAAAIDLAEARAEDLARLPGVGPSRAELVIAWRGRHGPFRSIFDLLRIPGVGRKLFLSMTGLPSAVTKRRDRHERLNALIGLAPEERPSLGRIAEQIRLTLDLDGCLLADGEGVVLSASGGTDGRSELSAALAPKLFRRAHRYLVRLAPGGADLLVLPSATPPLALARTGTYYLVAQLKPGEDGLRAAGALAPIGTELDWLLGPRAVVRAGTVPPA